MNGTKHTPGPWHLDNGLILGHRESRQTTVAVVAPDPCFEANARLIAAAPDLYEALAQDTALFDAMLAILNAEDLFPHLSLGVIRQRRDAARSAITKAGGEI